MAIAPGPMITSPANQTPVNRGIAPGMIPASPDSGWKMIEEDPVQYRDAQRRGLEFVAGFIRDGRGIMGQNPLGRLVGLYQKPDGGDFVVISKSQDNPNDIRVFDLTNEWYGVETDELALVKKVLEMADGSGMSRDLTEYADFGKTERYISEVADDPNEGGFLNMVDAWKSSVGKDPVPPKTDSHIKLFAQGLNKKAGKIFSNTNQIVSNNAFGNNEDKPGLGQRIAQGLKNFSEGAKDTKMENTGEIGVKSEGTNPLVKGDIGGGSGKGKTKVDNTVVNMQGNVVRRGAPSLFAKKLSAFGKNLGIQAFDAISDSKNGNQATIDPKRTLRSGIAAHKGVENEESRNVAAKQKEFDTAQKMKFGYQEKAADREAKLKMHSKRYDWDYETGKKNTVEDAVALKKSQGVPSDYDTPPTSFYKSPKSTPPTGSQSKLSSFNKTPTSTPPTESQSKLSSFKVPTIPPTGIQSTINQFGTKPKPGANQMSNLGTFGQQNQPGKQPKVKPQYSGNKTGTSIKTQGRNLRTY